MTPAESIASHYQLRTVDRVIADLSVLTDDERSLAFSPLPPPEYHEAADCRWGGNLGIDFSFETKRSQIVRARIRVRRGNGLMKSAGLFVSCVALYKGNLVRNALKTHRGNQCAAAEYLGVHRNTIRRAIREFEINPQDMRPEKGSQ